MPAAAVCQPNFLLLASCHRLRLIQRRGSDDLSAKLWDVCTGQCIYGIQTHTCAAVKFDEQKLVTGSFDNTIACWEWCIYGIQTHTCAAVKFDEQKLVTGSFDNTIACWEWSTGAKIQQFRGHTGAVAVMSQYIVLYSLLCTNCICFCDSKPAQGTLLTWSHIAERVIKTQDSANLSLLSLGEVFALLFDNHYLYIMDLRTEQITGRWPLPAYRKSKRGSSFLPGVTGWLNGLDGSNDAGLVFATSMPDHSIHLVLWKVNE
ncbi:UNVERIFIED_CONTAM: hypothetical protein FKN15_075835 [Acipenser sinensis]